MSDLRPARGRFVLLLAEHGTRGRNWPGIATSTALLTCPGAGLIHLFATAGVFGPNDIIGGGFQSGVNRGYLPSYDAPVKLTNLGHILNVEYTTGRAYILISGEKNYLPDEAGYTLMSPVRINNRGRFWRAR